MCACAYARVFVRQEDKQGTERKVHGGKLVIDPIHSPHRSDLLHCRVVDGSKHECNAALLDAFLHLLRGEVDFDAKCLENVSASAGRRH